MSRYKITLYVLHIMFLLQYFCVFSKSHSMRLQNVYNIRNHCTKMKPMALRCCSPLSERYCEASFPHVLESSGYPPVPNPILESQEMQSFSLLLVIPILALEAALLSHTTLNPSLLQLACKEACEPISAFHVWRPSKLLRYCPSAISEYRDLACLLMTMKLICWAIFIHVPRQILEKGVFQ